MHERILAKRYAAALFRAAQRQGLVAQVESDLREIDRLIAAVPKLLASLKQPLLPAAEKHRIIDRALGERIAPITSQFLKLLVAKRRAGLLPLVFDAFVRFAEELRNEARMIVTSAAPLAESERVELTAVLSVRTNKTLKPEFAVDPELIGGVLARIGDTVYDGSLSSELRQMAEKLTVGRR